MLQPIASTILMYRKIRLKSCGVLKVQRVLQFDASCKRLPRIVGVRPPTVALGKPCQQLQRMTHVPPGHKI